MSAPVAETRVTARLQPVPSAATSITSSATVMVDVVGAVRRPGVVRLPLGARVVDAVAAAGGLLPERLPVVNMARTVVDGEQIVIGAQAAVGDATRAGQSSASHRIDLNAASAAELDALPGIGPVLAQRIVEYRDAHGPFTHTRDLLEVPGIGDAKFSELSSAVMVS